MVRMSTLEEWNFTDTSKQKPYGWKEVPVLQTNDFQYQPEFQYHFQYQSTTVQYSTIYMSHYNFSLQKFLLSGVPKKHASPASWKCNLSQLVTTCHCLRSPGCGQKPQVDLGSGFLIGWASTDWIRFCKVWNLGSHSFFRREAQDLDDTY